jgi:hypothetical protein
MLANCGIRSSRNQKRLHSLQNKHKGEKAVIIGMGPSLQANDLERFSGYTTFACNKIYLGFEGTSWRPDYYSVNDVIVAQNNNDRILDADFRQTQCLHSCIVAPELKTHNDPIIYHYRGDIQKLNSRETKPFIQSLQLGIRSGGCSICIDQIQLAYLMGFKEVCLVGIDFSFQINQPTTIGNSLSGKLIEATDEQNHFHKDYRKPGEKWTVPRLDEQRYAFLHCKHLFQNSGRKLVNASRISKLDVIDPVDFETYFTP